MADRDVLINLIVNGRNNAKGALKDVVGDLENLKKNTRDYTKEINAKDKAEKENIKTSQMMGKTFDKQASQLQGWIGKLAESQKKLNAIASGSGAVSKKFSKDIDSLGDSFGNLKKYVEQYISQANKSAEANRQIKKDLKDLRKGTKEYEEAVNGIAKALGKEVDEIKNSIDAMKKKEAATKKAARADFDAALAIEKSRQAMLDYQVVMKEHMENTQKMSELQFRIAAFKEEQMWASRAHALKDYVHEQGEAKRSLDETADSLDNLSDAMAKNAAIKSEEIHKRRAEALMAETAEQERNTQAKIDATKAEDDYIKAMSGKENASSGMYSPNVARSQVRVAKDHYKDNEVAKSMEVITEKTKEANKEMSLFAKTINKISGGKVSLDDKNDQFKNLRGLTSELRGFGIAFAIKNIQGLASAGVGAAGGLTSLAASAISAGGALGGALAAGAAQAIGPLGVLAATIGRITSITKVLNLKQQIAEASNHTNQADAVGGAADGVAAAQDRIADSLRGVTQAQKDYNDAVREAKRNLQDMRLEQARANLGLEDAQRNLTMANLGNDTAAIANARIDLKEAQLKARRAGQDNARAQKGGVQGDPGVVSARERIADANKQAAQATRALAQAQKSLAASGDGATASQDRLNYMLAQLTGNERRLVTSVENLKSAYKKSFRGVSDIIIGEIANSVDVVTKLFARPDIIKPFMDNAKAGAAAIKQITSFLGSENTIEFFKIFTEQSTKNIPKLTTGLINLGKAFMNIADNSAGVFNVILDDAVKLTENIAKATANSGEFFSNSLKDYEAWRGLLGQIWQLFKVIFEPARAAGMQAITIWTKEIAKFVDKLKANPDAVSKFFSDGVYASNQILRVVWEIGKALYEVFKPESVKALADFLIMIVVPAFKQVILTIGVVTHVVQKFLAMPVVSNLARWILTITLLSRAFAIMTSAVKNIGLALAGAASMLAGGAGFANKMRLFAGIVILVASALGAMGVSLEDMNKFFKEHTVIVTLATSALGGFMALLAVTRVAAYINSVGSLTKAFKSLAAAEAIAGAASFFGKGKANLAIPPNLRGKNSGGGIMGRIGGMSKAAKGVGAAGIIGGVGAAIGGAVIGGKTGNFLSNAGAGAATGASIGMLAGPWGAAIGGVTGGLIGLGSAYLSTKKKQESFTDSIKAATDALTKQLDAIKNIDDARAAKEDSKLNYQQAKIDYRSARTGVNTTVSQLKAEGLSMGQIKKDDRYKQSVIDRKRALAALKKAEEDYTSTSNKKIKDTAKQSEKTIREGNQKILKAVDVANRKVNDAEKEYAGAKKHSEAAAAFGKNSEQFVAAKKRERKALEKLNDANKEYRSSLNKVPAAYANVTSAGKSLNKSFAGSKGAFVKLMKVIVAGTNGVLKGFNAKPLKFSVSDDGYTLIQSENKDGDVNVSVDGAGYASGGFIGRMGQKGKDAVHTVLGKGEAVLNGTQQKIVNSALYQSGMNGLGEVFARTKGSKHYLASGGFAGFPTPHAGVAKATQNILKKFPGLSVTSTTGGNHVSGSDHYAGNAVDIGGPVDMMNAASSWIKRSGMGKRLKQGIHNPNLSINAGQSVPSSFWGPSIWAGHANHIHIAVAGALGKFAGAAAGSMSAAFKKLKAPKVSGGGSLGKILNAASKKITSAANKKLRKVAASMGGTGLDTESPNPRTRGGKDSIRGKVSVFGPPLEPLNGTAYGYGSNAAGIAVNPDMGSDTWNNARAQSWGKRLAKVRIGAKKAVLRVVDKGPSIPGRAIDVTGAGALKMGIDPYKFPTDAIGTAQLLARGGFAGTFHGGGSIPGSGEKLARVKGGETVFTGAQLSKLLDGFEKLSTSLLAASIKDRTIRPDYGSSDSALRGDIKNITAGRKNHKNPNKGLDKALKAIRDITADNGVIAQFATVLETFSNRLANALKIGSYHFSKSGKAVKAMTDLEIGRQTVENIGKQGNVLGKQIKKVRAARRTAQKASDKAENIRDDIDEDLGGLYDQLERRKAAGLDTKVVERSIKKREARLKKTKKGKKKLSKFKKANSRAGKLKKDVAGISASLEEMEANRADLAQQAYDAQYDFIQTQNSSSQEAQDISNTNSDIFQAGSVSNGAMANIRNSALASRNSDITKSGGLIDQLTALGGKDSEIAKLKQEVELNNQEMKRNTVATMVNTSQIKQSLVAFKSSIIGTGINIFKALGALTGTTDNAAITGALTKNGANLTGNRKDIIGSLNEFLGTKGMAGIDPNLSGGALASSIIGLSGTNTLGWTTEEQDAFQNWLSALGDNELAIIDNTQQLKDLNGNNDQGFSSYSWTAFRKAVFDGTGGLMPNVKDLVPHAAVGADVVSDGLAYVHAAEVILNKNDAKTWKGAGGNGDVHVNITTPQEVADPVVIGNKIMFELNNRGK